MQQLSAEKQQLISYHFSIIEPDATDDQIIKGYEKTEDEFCAVLKPSAQLVDRLCQLGIMPMGARLLGEDIFLPKLHIERCLLSFENLHISKKVKKKSVAFSLTMNKAFELCFEAVCNQHTNSWFSPLLKSLYLQIYNSTRYTTRFHSVELWQDNQLVAGEIGYQVGSIYSSLSGFYTQDSSGSIQLCALGSLLRDTGFAFWDLGMYMPYKEELGATCVSRDEFIRLVAQHRDHLIEIPDQIWNAKSLIMQNMQLITG